MIQIRYGMDNGFSNGYNDSDTDGWGYIDVDDDDY